MDSSYSNQLPSYHNNTFNGTFHYRVNDFACFSPQSLSVSQDNYVASIGQQILLITDLEQASNTQFSGSFGTAPALHQFKNTSNSTLSNRVTQLRSDEDCFSPWAELHPRYFPTDPLAIIQKNQVDKFVPNSNNPISNQAPMALSDQNMGNSLPTVNIPLSTPTHPSPLHDLSQVMPNQPNFNPLSPKQQELLLYTPQIFNNDIAYVNSIKGINILGPTRKNYAFSMLEDPSDLTWSPIIWWLQKCQPPTSKLHEWVLSTQINAAVFNGFSYLKHLFWHYPQQRRVNQYVAQPNFTAATWSPRGIFPGGETTSLLAVLSKLSPPPSPVSVSILSPTTHSASGEFARAPLVANVRAILQAEIQNQWFQLKACMEQLLKKVEIK